MSSLLPAAVGEPALNAKDLAALQEKLWKLLSRRALLHTMGESTSLPEETAEELLRGVLYLIAAYQKEKGISLRALADMDLEQVCDDALPVIRRQVLRCKRLYKTARLKMPPVDNRSLSDTVTGIGQFFRQYDCRMFAHQIPCDIDYQLCCPLPDGLLGADYLSQYLQRLLTESRFLRLFEKERLHRLLSAALPDYRGLHINLFEPVLAAALALTLSGGDCFCLTLTNAQQEMLYRRLNLAGRAQTECMIENAAATLCDTLTIRSPQAQAYIQLCAEALCPRIEAALPSGSLDGVFPSP